MCELDDYFRNVYAYKKLDNVDLQYISELSLNNLHKYIYTPRLFFIDVNINGSNFTLNSKDIPIFLFIYLLIISVKDGEYNYSLFQSDKCVTVIVRSKSSKLIFSFLHCHTSLFREFSTRTEIVTTDVISYLNVFCYNDVFVTILEFEFFNGYYKQIYK